MSTIHFDGIGQEVVTFASRYTVSEGMPCKMYENGTVMYCAAGDDFIGVILAPIQDNVVPVQIRGFVTLPYIGTAPALGYCGLVADGTGKVKISSDAERKFLVVSVNPAAATVCILL